MREPTLEIANTLKLMVGYATGHYTYVSNIHRFFRICADLPDELQQLVANVVHGSRDAFVSQRAIDCAMSRGW
jgi:hypothetical protein